MKLEFKKELVPICFFYFFLFFSFNLVFPYFTLQLRTLGLTLDDAALIGGWVTVPKFPVFRNISIRGKSRVSFKDDIQKKKKKN